VGIRSTTGSNGGRGGEGGDRRCLSSRFEYHLAGRGETAARGAAAPPTGARCYSVTDGKVIVAVVPSSVSNVTAASE